MIWNTLRFLFPWFLILGMGVAWGLSFSLAKVAVNHGTAPLTLTVWQSIIAGILLLVLMFLRKISLPFSKNLLWLCLVIAICGFIIPGVSLYYAAPHVQAGVLSITVTLVPILTYAISIPFGFEKPEFKRILGLVFGTLAILLIVIPENSLPEPEAVPWILLSCLGSAFYSLEGIVIATKMPEKLNPIGVACIGNFLAVIFLLPLLYSSGQQMSLNWPPDTSGHAIFGISFISAIAYTLYIYVIKITGPLFASQSAYVVTLAGVFWGMAIFDEEHSLWVWASLLSMMVGLALVTPRRKSAELSSSVGLGLESRNSS